MRMRDQIMAAYLDACRMEIDALKPGNVHRFADGHRMTAQQFLESAEVTARPISDPASSVGRRILDAVAATRAAVGTNTNLGILLLCVPLAKAAEAVSFDLRQSLSHVLETMDQADARDVFGAIALANPGGLGTAENDVSRPPEVPLLVAMRQAAERDMIAKQYVTGFSDIFSGGLSSYADAMDQREQGMWPSVLVYLHFLSSFPDSHVARKHDIEIAKAVRAEAQEVRFNVVETNSEIARQEILLAFDRQLKARDINPGTSADLTVATLFAAKLNFILHNRRVNG
ncbi:MAG: triphosphoribosyl-dephospho-CoA synthase [Allorhizobium sp.]